MPDDARFVAAVLAVGPGAKLSHASAAAPWGIRPRGRGTIDVTVARRAKPRRGILIHAVRALAPSDVTRHKVIPITTPARTLLDLADVLPRRALARAVHEAEVQRLVTHEAVWRQVEQTRGRRAATLLATALADGPAPTRSELEDRALALFREQGLPNPRINVHVAGIEIDFLFSSARLIVEVHGARYHDTPFARRNDAYKQARLEAAGYRVIRLPGIRSPGGRRKRPPGSTGPSLPRPPWAELRVQATPRPSSTTPPSRATPQAAIRASGIYAAPA